jgi:hypothetical protein
MKRQAEQLSLDQAIQSYIASHRSKLTPISTKEAVAAIRAMVPDCEHLDDELATLIGAAAVRVGLSVYFSDLHGEK